MNAVRKTSEDDQLPDLDPLDDADFVVILGILAASLQKAARRSEAASLSSFVDALDIDWSKLSGPAVDRILAGAAAVLAGSVEDVIPRTSPIFAEAARAIIPATKARLIASEELTIGSSLSAADKETGRALLRQQGLYIRDEFGRRADTAAARAREIVAEALERGLGQQETAARLATDITLRTLARSRTYWEGIATAFANRARTSTQLNSYEEARIVTYRFVAVMDERTTDICRYMNGKTFRVSAAIALQRRAEKLDDAEDIKAAQPWVYKGQEDGQSMLYYEKHGRRRRVAFVDESAVGAQDARGIFSGGLSDEELEAAGILVPPLHWKCRSTIVTEG